MSRKSYHGSCHCGNVRYSAAIDFSLGTAKCNCSICMKMRIWHVMFKERHFSLLSEPDLMGEYQFVPAGREAARMHYFFLQEVRGFPLCVGRLLRRSLPRHSDHNARRRRP